MEVCFIDCAEYHSHYKFEARNPKFETGTNARNTNDPNEEVLNFENWKFGFVSDFDIRISDF